MISLLLALIYLAFVSLGLPDALLGSVWPTISPIFGVDEASLGIVSAIMSIGTIASSLLSDRLTKRLGVGLVTTISVALTAFALLGFSFCDGFVMICLFAIPYGIGAGGVDASLNNYVALHYSSRHMSWLHAMWGVGASVGPFVMSYALTIGSGWQDGFRYIFVIQCILTVILIVSMPLWKRVASRLSPTLSATTTNTKPLSLAQIFRIPGAKAIMLAFFCYCAVEGTIGIYASSYLVTHKGLDERTATMWASWYYIGITAGRLVNGLLTIKLHDRTLIRGGYSILSIGILIMLLPLDSTITMVGLVLAGIGSAPIYPCIIHSTPATFGADNSQALTGVQMASAYTGLLIMPPIFGLIASHINISLYPIYLLAITIVMITMYELLQKSTKHKKL